MNAFSTVISAIGGIGSLVAILIALRGIRKDRQTAMSEAKKRAADEATARAEQKLAQKQMLDELAKLNAAFDKHLTKYDDLKTQVIHVEERVEEAHRRIDEWRGNN